MEDRYGYVYAIGYDGEVKIGKSVSDPHRRLSQMQTGNARDLCLIASVYVAGYEELESVLHSQLKKEGKWIRGEWFKLELGEAVKILRGASARVQIMVAEHNIKSIEEFVEMRLVVLGSQDQRILAADLYEEYKSWNDGFGVTKVEFFRGLRSMGITIRNGTGNKVQAIGVKLVD